MAREKTITITYKKDGSKVIKTEGFAGAACKAASKPYEDKDAETISDHNTAEMYQSAAQVQQQQVGH